MAQGELSKYSRRLACVVPIYVASDIAARAKAKGIPVSAWLREHLLELVGASSAPARASQARSRSGAQAGRRRRP